MFIDYGIRGYEYIHRCTLDRARKNEYLENIGRVAGAMGVNAFPENFTDYLIKRNYLLTRRLARNRYTDQLFESYQKSLGALLYKTLLNVMYKFVPPTVRRKLKLKANPFFSPACWFYPYLRSGALLNIVLGVFLEKRIADALRGSKNVDPAPFDFHSGKAQSYDAAGGVR